MAFPRKLHRKKLCSMEGPEIIFFCAVVDRLQVSQFLFEQVSNLYTKLYFAFFAFVSLVNKLNVIFQSKSPAIHNFLSCFVKPNVIQRHATLIDAFDPANHLPLSQLHLGVEAAKLLLSDEYKVLDKQALADCFSRCKQFLVEVCFQMQKRLPLNNDVMRELKILDPQTTVSGSVQSLLGIALRFPHVVFPEYLQRLHQECREFIYDEETSLLLDQCSSTPTANSGVRFQQTNTRLWWHLPRPC